MWYISGKRWISSPEATQAERVYKIFHATSNDGIHWKRDNRLIVPDSIGADECQALPSVLEVDGVYHMVFCYRDAIGFRTEAGKGYRLGYAYSNDLVNWTRDDQVLGLELTGEGWDGQMMCYPHLFRLDERVAILYNGNNFGKEGFGLAMLESDINEHIKL
jgi:sucrose-6-phosphate hydrolase SacC (GH32 family)